ncbi:hypothetical protein D6T69_06875 [Tenacibaculum singaporense]|uniref:HD-CE domain-containing protein n=1 Tax=Tenacibaculum singaporense TaxID=2358479 RepID=A0A3Q8RR76_9FLAO|nr:hypothetical protein [Tenacibaculum singaporense]AZJ35255.1 hypothetical protein D6T69_06875 [Tenacibaculum singaporense]
MRIDLNEDIETEFLKFKDDLRYFPLGNDYVHIYKGFKTKFDKEIHPEVKVKILEIEKEGYYNDHGVDHIKMVIQRVSWILGDLNVTFKKEEEDSKFYISPYELFILLVAIQLHDTGHLIASRRDHARKGAELLTKFDSGKILSSGERQTISNIAKAHGGKDDPIGKLPSEDDISHKTIRPQFLAALLRLGDELAEDQTRASNFLLENKSIVPTSVIYHLYSASLQSVRVNGNELKLKFYISDEVLVKKFKVVTKNGEEEKFLLDEIYDRTYKTFTESIYCSRFLPEKCRINSVKVDVNLFNKNDDQNFKTLAYELRDSVYPGSNRESIFSKNESLFEGGKMIDGQNVLELIMKNREGKNEPV